MKHIYRRALWSVSLLLFLVVFATTTSADHDKKKHQQHKREHNENYDLGDRNIKPVKNTTYAEQCGACHFAYQPELLPQSSWMEIITGLGEHFGEVVALDEDSTRTITDYLTSNSAEKSSAKLSGRIMKSLGNQVPLRITMIPYITKEHREISTSVLQQKSIGSLSNCIACHTTAEVGIYDDDM